MSTELRKAWDDWLNRHQPLETIGYAQIETRCPVANFLSEYTGLAAKVKHTSITLGELVLPTPEELRTIIYIVDLLPAQRSITPLFIRHQEGLDLDQAFRDYFLDSLAYVFKERGLGFHPSLTNVSVSRDDIIYTIRRFVDAATGAKAVSVDFEIGGPVVNYVDYQGLEHHFPLWPKPPGILLERLETAQSTSIAHINYIWYESLLRR